MLRFWELPPSPNNLKVRMALRFKGIDFRTETVDPRDRSGVLRASGQELTPAIEDRGIALNDSEAILQYLDANYRATPRLFPSDRAGRRRCDAWKSALDERVAASWLPLFLHGIGLRSDLDEDARRRFLDGLDWLESELAGQEGFSGGDAPVCDLRVAEWAVYALPGTALSERVPLVEKVSRLFGADAERLPRLSRFLEPWNERLA